MKIARSQPDIVRNIKRIAAKRGYSMNQLADFAGISRGNLSGIMRCEVNPTLLTLELLSDALGVSLGDLVA